MTFQNEVINEAADQLAATHDLLFADGWVQWEGVGENGSRCLVQAFYEVKHSRLTDNNNLSRQSRLVGLGHHLAMTRLMAITGASMVQWNDYRGRTLNEVLDALRVTEKNIRNSITE